MGEYHKEGVLDRDKALSLMKKYFRFEKSFDVRENVSKLGKILSADKILLSYSPKSFKKGLSGGGWEMTDEYIIPSYGTEKIYYYEIGPSGSFTYDSESDHWVILLDMSSEGPGILAVDSEDQAVLVCEFFQELLDLVEFDQLD